VLFYLMTNFTLTYGTAASDAVTPGLGFSYTHFVLMQVFGVVFFGIFTLVSGPLADSIGRRKLLIWVTVAIIVLGLVYTVFLLPRESEAFMGALVQTFLIFGFSLMGMTFGPMGALLPELFPTSVRYTGSAIAYNVSSILGAALAPIIALELWKAAGGNPWLVGIYMSGAGVLTLIALLLGKETKDVDLEAS
jgi:MFS family permease